MTFSTEFYKICSNHYHRIRMSFILGNSPQGIKHRLWWVTLCGENPYYVYINHWPIVKNLPSQEITWFYITRVLQENVWGNLPVIFLAVQQRLLKEISSTYRSIAMAIKILLSKYNNSPRDPNFGVKHLLEDLNELCSNYVSWIEISLAQGSFVLKGFKMKNLKKSFSQKSQEIKLRYLVWSNVC